MKKFLIVTFFLCTVLSFSSCTSEPTLMENLESVQSNPSLASSEDISTDNIEADVSLSEIELIENFVDVREKTLTIMAPDYSNLDNLQANAINKRLLELGTEYKLEFVYFSSKNQNESVLQIYEENLNIDIIAQGYGPLSQDFKNEYFMPLDTYLNSEEGAPLKNSLPSYLWQSLEYDGSIIGVKGSYHNGLLPSGYIVNKSYMEKYGLTEEDFKVNISELESILKTFKDSENIVPLKTNSLELLFNSKYILPMLTFSIDRNTKDVGYYFDTPQVDKDFRAIQKYIDEGLFEDTNSIGTPIDDIFIYYSAAFLKYNEFHPDFTTQTGGYAENNVDYVFIPINDTVYLDTVSNNVIGVNKNSKNQEDSLDFLTKLMTDKELTDLFSHGVKNVHYTIDEKSRVIPIYEPLYKDYFYNSSGSFFANSYISTPYYYEYENKSELMVDFEENIIVTEFAKFTIDLNKELMLSVEQKALEEVKSYIDDEAYEIIKMISEERPNDSVALKELSKQILQFIYPESNISYDELSAMLRQSLDNAGGQEVIAEIEKILLENGVK